jgi:glutaredoxin
MPRLTRRHLLPLLLFLPLVYLLHRLHMLHHSPRPQTHYLQSLRGDAPPPSSPATLSSPEIAADTLLSDLIRAHALLLFTKSTCPYSVRAKHLLMETYNLQPAVHVHELDDLPDLQDAVHRMTGRRTVPNFLVAGHSIGGADEMEALEKREELIGEVRKWGGNRVKGVYKLGGVKGG